MSTASAPRIPGRRRPLAPLPLLCAVALSATLATLSPSARAAALAGVALEDAIEVGGETLERQGAGVRKRLFIKLYVASLFHDGEAAGARDGLAVAAADAPMAIRLDILSDLLTEKKMVAALEEGFERSTGGDTGAVREGIDAMLVAMGGDDIDPGDRYDLLYEPGVGTRLLRNGEELAVVPGLDFKRALFGIWLGGDPVQRNLKEDLLGG